MNFFFARKHTHTHTYHHIYMKQKDSGSIYAQQKINTTIMLAKKNYKSKNTVLHR